MASVFNIMLTAIATASTRPRHTTFSIPTVRFPSFVTYICTDNPAVVQLAAWQQAGINSALSKNEKVMMSEFNSISCGGVSGISNSFAVGSLWTVDYALQLASVGYSAAHIHTREPGIAYNLFAASDQPANSSSSWTTFSPYYGVLVTAEALRSNNGAIVVDLTLGGVNSTDQYAGYAVYDASDKTVQQLVFFNYANVSASDNEKITFSIPESTFPSNTSQNVVVKYLSGKNGMTETTDIAWGGMTYANVVDGNLVKSSASWATASQQVDCSKGCNINVPSPGLAIAFAGGQPDSFTNSSNKTSLASPQLPASSGTSSIILAVLAIWTYLL